MIPTPLTLRIARAETIAAGIHRFELREPRARDLPAFSAGAHVAVRSPNGSVRRYSLCNDPAEKDRYVIAVKRDPKGRGGSVDLVDNAREGDMVEVSVPRNAFELAPRAASFILIAGGIGITPLMSMARALNRDRRRYKLYYLSRSRADAAFADELEGDEFRGKVVMHHDGGDPQRSFDLWPVLEKPAPGVHVYCCGPRALLEAVRARGHEAPSSCESGTCGTCRTALVAGEADHRDLVLADDEKKDQIMICVSRALSPEIAIDR